MKLTFAFRLLSLFSLVIYLQSCEPTETTETKSTTTLTQEESNSINQTDQAPSIPPPSDDQQAQEKAAPTIPQKRKTNQFEKVIRSVEQIDYELKKFAQLKGDQNFLNQQIESVNKYKSRQQRPHIPLVDTSNLLQVRHASIKGTVDLGGKLFTRAEVESWEMKDEAAAIAVEQEIKAIRKTRNWEDISKSPMTYFRKDNEIIFITPGGFYMLDKVPTIVDFLKAAL
ncbi:MAG: hypothetical protein AAF985_26505 [Bacteroidota bacterium]